VRPDYVNLDTLTPEGYDVVEPKRDGRWVTVDVLCGEAVMVSRTGSVLGRVSAPANIRAILCGEEIRGTERATSDADHGAVVVFDCIAADGRDLCRLPLRERRAIAADVVASLGAPFKLGEQYPASEAPRLWAEVEAGTLEGLVFKDSASQYGTPWGRLKPWLDIDLVVLGVTLRPDGTARNVIGGAHDKVGRLVRVCAVSAGLTDDDRAVLGRYADAFVGRVFTAYGRERTRSGSIRHPSWGGFHPDKPASACRV
jgi:ATP-dependent DNA ligase